MKSFSVILMGALLLVAVPMCDAQSTTQPPAPSSTPSSSSTPTSTTPEANQGLHFDVFTGYEKLTSGGEATVLGARLPVTPRWSLGYEQLQIPSASAQVFLGGLEFREVLGHLIKSQASKIDLSLIQVYGQFGVGTKRDSLGNNPTFSYGFKGGADFPLGQVGGGTLAAGVSFGYIGVPNQPGGVKHFVFGSTVAVSPQLSLRF